jgi:hypothetical protein
MLIQCMIICVSILTIAEKKLGQNDTNVTAKITANQTHHCCDQRGRDLRACVMEYRSQHIECNRVRVVIRTCGE